MKTAPPRLKAGPRSLRAKLIYVGLAFALLPLGLLAVAATYEAFVVDRHLGRLAAAADEAVGATGEAALGAVGRRHRVEVARLDGDGAVTARAGTWEEALDRSTVGAIGERLVGAAATERLEDADRALPAWPARAEVKRALAGEAASGTYPSPSRETLVITYARPLPGGGALYLLAGSHRGIRRLMFMRRQVVQLVVYEVVLALPLLLLFGVRFVRPIERLAAAARQYPAVPIADPALLARKDEIATLAEVLSELTADLERRRRQAAELGADVAHEFKSPLASIAAAGELLTTGRALTPDRVQLVASTIDAGVSRLRRSIDELLGLLRLEEAAPHEPRERVDYAAFLAAVIEEYRQDPACAEFRFTLEAGEDLGTVALNAGRWRELLRNLVDNALVQPATRKEIVVSARRTPAGLVTTVRDHGPGIAPEDEAKIFQRFYSARPPGVRPGTGLGLSIVVAIARAHGGRVAVNGRPGLGAELGVTLPA
jgi:signal transduction histidine kinase